MTATSTVEIPESVADLIPFCGVDTNRHRINLPFVRGPHIFATDGKIAVRRLNATGWPENLKTPDMTEIFAKFTRDVCIHELKDLPSGIECTICNGSLKKSETECPECEGEGYEEHDCDCEHCTRTTGDRCDECDGIGEVDPYDVDCECCSGVVHLNADGIFSIAMKTARALATLKNLRVSKPSYYGSPMYFIADAGIEGVFMPMIR
jgi:hypothetical protein